MSQEHHLERIKEHWKSSGSKRKDSAIPSDCCSYFDSHAIDVQ
ncbi:hypothetical protein HanPSC8_Chr12g0515461 [Helianthus annuus]|nr:hypothetical protein HanPSC8_Chr12g0515461 [Helianthus annuus]